MSMEKPVAALEITNKAIKLVVGYELNGKVSILYSQVKVLGEIKHQDRIVDINSLANSLNEIKNIYDDASKLKIHVTEVLSALPPKDLQVFTTQQITSIVADDSRVGNVDIRNINALIRRSRLPSGPNSRLVDIIPNRYVLDQGRMYTRAPIGESTSTLTLLANVHTLPMEIISDHENAINAGGLNIRRQIVAPFAASELLGSYPDIPADYILVDIGAKQTTVSLIGNKTLYLSSVFNWGGDYITNKIVETFNIPESEAEKLKVSYGLEKRELNFKAPVATYTSEDGRVVKHYLDELNEIVKGEVDVFVTLLQDSINNLLKDSNPTYKSLPMVLIGGGSLLKGLTNYILPKVTSNTVQVAIPTTLGCRNPAFFNCLGMIYVQGKYPQPSDEKTPKMDQVTRNSQ